MKKISHQELVKSAMVAALYFCVSILLAPISFGPFQVRVAESLAVLPILAPMGIWGVTLGCALTNAYGIAIGANILGAVDVFVGTAATLISALLSYGTRKIKVRGVAALSIFWPIAINALAVGGELTFAITGKVNNPMFFVYAGQVFIGQFISCAILGTILLKWLEKSKVIEKYFHS